MHACMYASMYVCMYVCMCICMYVRSVCIHMCVCYFAHVCEGVCDPREFRNPQMRHWHWNFGAPETWLHGWMRLVFYFFV